MAKGCLLGRKSRVMEPGAVTVLRDVKCGEVTWQSWSCEDRQTDAE